MNESTFKRPDFTFNFVTSCDCHPSDCTSEYVRGAAGRSDDVTGLVTSGLPAVTVLVGVFRRSSGEPVMGVVTQPFSRLQGDG